MGTKSLRNRIRDEIPGPEWYLGIVVLGLAVGLLAGAGVSDLYPDRSAVPSSSV
jgi:hypothetical protein